MELTDAVFPEITRPQIPEISEEALAGLKDAARLINEAKRPVIISGHGVMTSGANKELLLLADRSGIPVITTLLGLGSFPGGHPLSMGMLGMHGMYWANLSVDQADLIVGVGMRFDDRVTSKVDTFAPHARIVHMDIDPSQIGRSVPVEVPIVGDAKALLHNLTPMVSNVPHTEWMQYIENLKRDHPSLTIPASDMLQPQQVITAMDTLVQDRPETTVVTGAGQHQTRAAQFLSLNHENTFVSSGWLGAMGFELPAALGVQVAKPEAPVWVVAGDGGFQMTLQELVTLTEEGLPVKIALINNGHLGMVKQWQEMYYDGHLKAVPVDGPDFIKLAEAYGVNATRVTE